MVVDEDRGSLPFALVHGEALVACAAWALGEAGVTCSTRGTPWESVHDAERGPLVLHDALCPMTPPAFIAACVEQRVDAGAVVVGVRPVTDTVKAPSTTAPVGATVDREALVGRRLAGRAAGRAWCAALDALPDPGPRRPGRARCAERSRSSCSGAARGAAGRLDDDLALLEALTERRDARPSRPPVRRGLTSGSASARSSGKVILRLTGLLGTAADRARRRTAASRPPCRCPVKPSPRPRR